MTLLSELPIELLIKILLFSSPSCIKAFSTTNQFFHDVVSQSVELQILMLCIRYGTAFHPDAPESLADKRLQLERIEERWQSGIPARVMEINMPDNTAGSIGAFFCDYARVTSVSHETVYDMCGGHYCVSSADRRVTWNLPLRSLNPKWRATDLNQNMVDYGHAIHESDLAAYAT